MTHFKLNVHDSEKGKIFVCWFTRVTHAAHHPCLAAVQSHHSWAWVSSMEKKTVGHVNLWEEKELESYLLGTDFLSTPFQMLHPTRGSQSCAGTQRKVIKQATLHLDKEHTAVGRPSEVSLPNFKLQKPKACRGGVVWSGLEIEHEGQRKKGPSSVPQVIFRNSNTKHSLISSQAKKD